MTSWARSWLVGAWSLWALACSAGQQPAPASPRAAPAAAAQGRSAEAPLLTCGPKDSYDYVANRFRCPNGQNPLAGDLANGQRARRGSQPSPRGTHILDVYDVPCEGGPVTLYIDMYGCPEYEQQLHESARGTPEAAALKQAFQDGDFTGVIARSESLGPDAKNDEHTWCLSLVPASLYAQRRKTEALAALSHMCMRMPPASADSNARAQQLALTLFALASLAESGKFEASEEQREAIIESWLQACKVPTAQLQDALEAMQE